MPPKSFFPSAASTTAHLHLGKQATNKPHQTYLYKNVSDLMLWKYSVSIHMGSDSNVPDVCHEKRTELHKKVKLISTHYFISSKSTEMLAFYHVITCN